MSAQRSILSFFSSSSSSSSSSAKPKEQKLPQLLPKPAFNSTVPPPPPPPPPPPSRSKFVPPPPKNGALAAPPTGRVLRSGGSPAPNLDLPPITPALGQSILRAAGAEARFAEEDDEVDLVFPTSSSDALSSSSSTPRIVFPRPRHLPDLVSVNAILLSVRYPDSFYRFVADRTRAASLFNRVILGDDGEAVVGGIVCRLEPSPFEAPPGASGDALSGAITTTPSSDAARPRALAVYIQSLALLSPYRGRGLVAAALESIVAAARAWNAAYKSVGGDAAPIRALYAHAWTESADVLAWYAARGFSRHGAGPVEGYYYALRPSTAWVVRRDLEDGGGEDDGQAEKAAPKAVAAASAAPTKTTTTTTSTTPSSLSYQNARPETEWNDMPAEMLSASAAGSASASLASSRNVSRRDLLDGATESPNSDGPLAPPSSSLLAPPASGSSSRSSSTGRKKRERAYPAAMFQQQQQ